MIENIQATALFVLTLCFVYCICFDKPKNEKVLVIWGLSIMGSSAIFVITTLIRIWQ